MPACVREEEMQNIMPGGLENKHGEKGTFVIYVKYRQNATWQGEMLWLEGNLKISFRSVLELLKLIDSTFEIGNAETTLAHG